MLNQKREFLAENLLDLSDLQVSQDDIFVLEELTTGAIYCNKTGRVITILQEHDLVELHTLYSFNRDEKLNINGLEYALQQHVHNAWLNTSPEQLTMHIKLNPVDFFCYATKRLFSVTSNDYDLHIKLSELHSQLLRKTRHVEFGVTTKNHLVLINEKLRRILSMVGKKELRTNIKTKVSIQNINAHVLKHYEDKIDLVLGEVGKLYQNRYGNALTPTTISDKREKLGGDTSVAMTYERETNKAKRRWLNYLSIEDNSFSSKVYDTILSSISADLLLMPSNDKHFTDTKITSTKLDTIKSRLNRYLNQRDKIKKDNEVVNQTLSVLDELNLEDLF